MTKQFQDIKVVDILDKEPVFLSTKSNLVSLSLHISPEAGLGWCQDFNNNWQNSVHKSRCTAVAGVNKIVVSCILDEFEKYLPELKKVVEETNSALRKHLEEQSERDQKAAERVERAKETLSQLRAKIRSDTR